jgi:hypothetical protein
VTKTGLGLVRGCRGHLQAIAKIHYGGIANYILQFTTARIESSRSTLS